VTKTYLLASALDPQAAAEAVAAALEPRDFGIVAPSARAHATAALALRGRGVFTIEEPLLAERGPAESSADVLARTVRALRDARAYDACSPLIVFDRLDILGAATFVLDEETLARLADGLDRVLPLP
jgi:hypothetical protein